VLPLLFPRREALDAKEKRVLEDLIEALSSIGTLLEVEWLMVVKWNDSIGR
jgi:hypothetical protein